MTEIKPGKYRHYKGKLYEVIGIGNHSETLEQLVIYKSLYDSEKFEKGTLWARSAEMFLETIEKNGKQIPRFEYVGD